MHQSVRRDAGAAALYLLAGVIVFVVLAFATFGCHSAGLAAPCDELTLAKLTADCRAQVRSDCARSDAGTVDETCPTLKACDARIKSWLDCHVGADAGEGGAQ